MPESEDEINSEYESDNNDNNDNKNDNNESKKPSKKSKKPSKTLNYEGLVFHLRADYRLN